MEADALSDVLRTVRLTGAMFFLWDVSWPFATPVPAGRTFAPVVLPGAQEIVSYHIVSQGCCFGALIGESPVRLEAGDILLIPHGEPYVIASHAETCARARVEPRAAMDFFRQMADGTLPFVVEDGGGGETTTRLVCGFLGCDVRPFNPLLAALPRLVRLRPSGDPAEQRLNALAEYAIAEARGPSAGSAAVLVRLGELLFVEVIRRCLSEATSASTGWAAALENPVAGRALTLLHRCPTRAWTLDSLASEVGASRSRLADVFTRLVGEPPMHYLTRWRLQLAARALADGTAKVAAVAHDVGYASEAAFSRAFKRHVGVAPAEWRRDARRAASRTSQN